MSCWQKAPVHLHDKVHDGESKSEEGENGERVGATSSSSKLSPDWVPNSSSKLARTCLPLHKIITKLFQKTLFWFWFYSLTTKVSKKPFFI